MIDLIAVECLLLTASWLLARYANRASVIYDRRRALRRRLGMRD